MAWSPVSEKILRLAKQLAGRIAFFSPVLEVEKESRSEDGDLAAFLSFLASLGERMNARIVGSLR